MTPFRLCFAHLLVLATSLTLASGDGSTTVVAVTSTKTVHVTATDYAGACDNFVGACVVYGTAGNAPYTTTVYASTSPTSQSLTTPTTTIIATTTASNSGDCAGFVGACVVYATNSGNAPATTAYYAGGNDGHQGLGNAQGYIGPKKPDSDGFIGGSSGHQPIQKLLIVSGIAAAFGLTFWI